MDLNDLWVFDTNTLVWSFMGGRKSVDTAGAVKTKYPENLGGEIHRTSYIARINRLTYPSLCRRGSAWKS